MKCISLFSVIALVFLSGCLRVVRPMPPRVPPPQPQGAPMTYDEAVYLGASYAYNRGYGYHLKKARLAGDQWKVQLDVWTADAKGHLKLAYHAHSRALLKVNEKLKGSKGDKEHKHGKWDDNEWDDDHPGRGPPPGAGPPPHAHPASAADPDGHPGKGKAKGHDKHGKD
jgi:hypothetical protein